MNVSCACGKVQFEAAGNPIVAVACYCDDCQAGAAQLEALPQAAPVQDADGAADYLLYRKDRFQCLQGSELLMDIRLRPTSPTKRVVARCCNSGLYLDFAKGHWLSVFRTRFTGVVPPLQMRIQTRFRSATTAVPDDVPAHASFSVGLVARLLWARAAMLLPG